MDGEDEVIFQKDGNVTKRKGGAERMRRISEEIVKMNNTRKMA